MAISLNNNTISCDGTAGVITLPSSKTISYAGNLGIRNNGQIIGVTHFTNSTRTALSATTSTTLWSAGNVNKKIANSKLVIVGQLVFGDGEGYNQGYWWQIGSSGLRRDGIFMDHYHTDANSNTPIKIGWFINGEYSTSATGNLAVSIGWAAINGASDWPGQVWNPNTSDDSRSQQHSSNLTVFEVVTG